MMVMTIGESQSTCTLVGNWKKGIWVSVFGKQTAR